MIIVGGCSYVVFLVGDICGGSVVVVPDVNGT